MVKAFQTSALAAVFAAAAITGVRAADPIKIGVVTPLCGTYARIGKQVRWGAELAVKEINAAGGVMGRPIELLYEDEEANPAVAVRKAEKLFQLDKVDFLTGTVNSGSTLAVGQLAERAGKLIATTVSFADSITGDRMLAQRLPRQRQRLSAIDRADGLADQEKPPAKRILHRPGLRDGPLHHRRVQGRHRAARRQRRRRDLRAARRQGLHAVYRPDPRGARPT